MTSRKIIGGTLAAAAFMGSGGVAMADAPKNQRARGDDSQRGAALRLIDARPSALPRTPREGERMIVRLRLEQNGAFDEPVFSEADKKIHPRDILHDGSRRLATASKDEPGPVAHAACPVCIPAAIVISAAARAAAARMVGSATAAAAARSMARAALPVIRAGAQKTFPNLKFPVRQVQKKFKHAPDFGVGQAWNASAPQAFEAAIKKHLADAGTYRIFGSVRGVKEPVVHFYNPLTRRVATFTRHGDFHTAYYIRDDGAATRLAAFGHLGKNLG